MRTITIAWSMLLIVLIGVSGFAQSINCKDAYAVGEPVVVKWSRPVGAVTWKVVPIPPKPGGVIVDGKTLYVWAPAGEYRIEATAKRAGEWRTITIGKPDPNPDPTPVPTQKLAVVIVEESADRALLPPSQIQALVGTQITKYMASKGHLFRRVDQDVKDQAGKVPADIESFLQRASGKRLPWIIIANQAGNVLCEQVLPDSESETIDLIKRYGGQ